MRGRPVADAAARAGARRVGFASELVNLGDRRLQRRRARVLQVEDDVVQRLGHLQGLGGRLAIGVGDGVPRENCGAVEHVQGRHHARVIRPRAAAAHIHVI